MLLGTLCINIEVKQIFKLIIVSCDHAFVMKPMILLMNPITQQKMYSCFLFVM